jgi:putative membrane protein
METYAYRIMAPRHSRAVARARVCDIGTPERLAWLMAAIMAAALAFGAATPARSQSSSPAASAAPSTSEYVEQSALTYIFEVNSSRLALEKSQNSAIRDFAQQVVDEKTQAATKLSEAVKSGEAGVPVPVLLDARRQEEMKRLQSKSGVAFDEAYVRAQLQGHRNALDLQRAYAQSGDNPALQQLASQTSLVVQRQLAKLEVLAQQSFRSAHEPSSGNSGGIGAI